MQENIYRENEIGWDIEKFLIWLLLAIVIEQVY